MSDSNADRPIWPGATLTFRRLGLLLDWEPSPPPASNEPPQELAYALLVEKRRRQLALCPVERAMLAPQPEGRRTPPAYGLCAECGWAHALPPEGSAE